MDCYVPDVNSEISKGVRVMERGGIVVYPTDTVYGLGANIFNNTAVERVFEAKGRPKGMPLPVLLPSVDSLRVVAHNIPSIAWTLAEEFWPGQLTLILPSRPEVPSIITARGWTIAVRVPDHPVPLALARELGSPITGTSANRSGHPVPETISEAHEQLQHSVDYLIRVGPKPSGRPSTILDITQIPPRILRSGSISYSSLAKFVTNIQRPSGAN
jgi:L-threonylcarbamoyladenylate synthase